MTPMSPQTLRRRSNFNFVAAAKYVGVSRTTIYKWVKNQDVRVMQFGHIRRISREELDRLKRVVIQPERTPIPKRGGVYFFRCGDFVKIGQTQDLACRLETFESDNPQPVECLAFVDCEIRTQRLRVEAAFHEQFATLRHKYEWFRYESPLIEFIQQLANEPQRVA